MKNSEMLDFQKLREVMVDTQIRPSDVTKYNIIAALLDVPREIFVPTEMRDVAYMGDSIDLSRNRSVLDPRVFAKMLDAVNIQDTEFVLDIGSAYGYSAAVLSKLAQAVIAVEPEKDLNHDMEKTFLDLGVDNVVLEQNALAEGAPAHAPYDVIIVQGMVETIPATLSEQLRIGGRIIALFQEGQFGQCRIGLKKQDKIHYRYLFDAAAPVMPGFEKEAAFEF